MESPESLVRRFLAALARRDAAECRACLTADPVLEGPGGSALHSIEAQFERSRQRYQHVDKDFSGFDTIVRTDGVTVVYCHGTLRGRLASGQDFSGIRFIDRFELESGLIRRQSVWNDMASAGLLPA